MNAGTDRNERPPEDLTSRARIRDAALAQFAEHGTKGATIRGIAAAAGVSPGLVQHHFGSKDALREACDKYVIDTFDGLDRFGLANGEITQPEFMDELFTKSSLVLRYIARGMAEDAPVATALFDTGANVSEQFLVRVAPERFPAGSDKAREAGAAMAAMHLSPVMLHELLSRRMGGDMLSPPNSARFGQVVLDIYAAVAVFATSNVGDGLRSAVDDWQKHYDQSSRPPISGPDDGQSDG